MTEPTRTPAPKATGTKRPPFIEALMNSIGDPQPPPAEKPVTGKPSTGKAPAKAPAKAPTQKGYEVGKKPAFVESLFQYQDQVNKMMDQKLKEANEEEKRIIKEGLPGVGLPGLGGTPLSLDEETPVGGPGLPQMGTLPSGEPSGQPISPLQPQGIYPSGEPSGGRVSPLPERPYEAPSGESNIQGVLDFINPMDQYRNFRDAGKNIAEVYRQNQSLNPPSPEVLERQSPAKKKRSFRDWLRGENLDTSGIIYPESQTQFDNLVPQELRQNMSWMSQEEPRSARELIMQNFPVFSWAVGVASKPLLDIFPGGKLMYEEQAQKFNRAPLGEPNDIPILRWMKLVPSGNLELDLKRLEEAKPGDPNTKLAMLSTEARLAAEWIAFPYALRGTRLAIAHYTPKLNNLLFKYDMRTIMQNSKLRKLLKDQLARLRAKMAGGDRAVQQEVKLLERWVNNFEKEGSFQPYRFDPREGIGIVDKETGRVIYPERPDYLHTVEGAATSRVPRRGPVSPDAEMEAIMGEEAFEAAVNRGTIRPPGPTAQGTEAGRKSLLRDPEKVYLTGEAAEANMPKWTEGPLYEGRAGTGQVKTPVEPFRTEYGKFAEGETLAEIEGTKAAIRQVPDKRYGLGKGEGPTQTKLKKRGGKREGYQGTKAKEGKEGAPSIIRPGEVKPGTGKIITQEGRGAVRETRRPPTAEEAAEIAKGKGPEVGPGGMVKGTTPKEKPGFPPERQIKHGKGTYDVPPKSTTGSKRPAKGSPEKWTKGEIKQEISDIEKLTDGEILEFGGGRRISEFFEGLVRNPRRAAKRAGQAAYKTVTRKDLDQAKADLAEGIYKPLSEAKYGFDQSQIYEQYVRLNAIDIIKEGGMIKEGVLKQFSSESWAKAALNKTYIPIKAYHGSPDKVGQFTIGKSKGGFGLHFGNERQAKYVAGAEGKARGRPGIVHEVELDIKNPLRMHDTGFTDPAIMATVNPPKVFSPAELSKLEKGTLQDWKAAIKAKGYDGVVYKNKTKEGVGDSFIAFEDNQIKVLNVKSPASKAKSPQTHKQLVKEADNFVKATNDKAAKDAASRGNVSLDEWYQASKKRINDRFEQKKMSPGGKEDELRTLASRKSRYEADAQGAEYRMRDVVHKEGGIYQGVTKNDPLGPQVEIRLPKADNTNIQIPLKDFNPKTVKAKIDQTMKNYEAGKAATPMTEIEKIQDAKGFVAAVNKSIDKKGNLTRGGDVYKKMLDRIGDEKDLKQLHTWAKNHSNPQVRRTILEHIEAEARARKFSLEDPYPAKPARLESFTDDPAMQKYVDNTNKIADQLESGKITQKQADEMMKANKSIYDKNKKSTGPKPKKKPAPKEPEAPTEPKSPERTPEMFRFGGKAESKEEFMSMVDAALAKSRASERLAGQEVMFEFKGTKYRINDNPDALESFLKEIKKTGFKVTSPGKEPQVGTKALGKRVKLGEGDTYYRELKGSVKTYNVKEADFFISHKVKPKDNLLRKVEVSGKTGYTDGKVLEIRKTKPEFKGEFSEEVIKPGAEFAGWVDGKGYKLAKSNFETQEGVWVHTKTRGELIDPKYWDYIRNKYGEAVEWMLGPKKGQPVRFSVNGEVKGLIHPEDRTSRVIDVFKQYKKDTGITLEMGGGQKTYEMLKDIIKKGGGFPGALWPRDTPGKLAGKVGITSPYTRGTVHMLPEEVTEQSVKSWLLNNYKTVRAAGSKPGSGMEKLWPEGEAFIKGPPVGETTMDFGGGQKTYEKFMKLLKGAGKDKKLPKYARAVNLERQDIAQEMKQFQVEVGKMSPKTYQSWDTSQELADEIMEEYYRGAVGKTKKLLDKIRKGHGLNTQEMLAVRQIQVNNIGRLKEIIESGASPEKFNEHFLQYVDEIFTTTSNASSEVGRALNIHKKTVSINRMANAFVKLRRGLRPRELAEFKALNFENPYEVQRFISRLGDPKLQDYIFEYWYNQILSGPPTHLVNTISNTTWGMFQLPHRALTGGMDAMFGMLPSYQRKIYMSEIFPMLAGYKTGFLKGAAGAREMIRTGRIMEYETKWARDMGHNVIGAFERSPHKLLRQAAPYISAPTRVLRAMDVWANSMAFDAQLGALARRKGLQQGLKGKELAKFTKDFLRNPSRESLEGAAKFARYSTFMDDPGNITRGFTYLRQQFPYETGRLVVPFINTIGNLTKRGVEMIPGVGLTLARGQAPAEVLAKQIEGTILSYYILQKAAKGEITGRAPVNKAEREAFYRDGKLPWAIKIGDTYYSYRRMEPFNTVMASAAIFHEKILNAPDEATATQMFGDYTDGMIDNLLDSSYLQGMTQAIDRYGSREGMVRKIAASFTPGSSFLRSTKRAFEVATMGEATLRESKDLLGAFAQVIPMSILSLGIPKIKEKVPARQDVYGKNIVIPGGVVRQFLPYKAAKATKDPVEIAFSELNAQLKEAEKDTLFLGMPEKEINGNELTDAQWRDYVRIRGELARRRFEGIIKSSAWKNIPIDVKRRRLESRWKSAGRIARLKMKAKYPHLGKPGKFKTKEERKAQEG